MVNIFEVQVQDPYSDLFTIDVGISTKKKFGLQKISPPVSIANAIACGSKIF